MPAVSSRGRGRRTISEINMVPFIDVMLVLLIIFMISAPLLTAGVPVELPKTEAGAMQDVPDPITVSIRADGRIYVADNEVPFANLSPRLKAMADDTTRPIYVRADAKASYGTVAQVMASLSTSGFSAINLITDTGGPSSGGDENEAAP